jgi:hypothetical protein
MAYNIGWDTTTDRQYFKKLMKAVFRSTDRPGWTEYKQMFRLISSADEYEKFGRDAGLPLAENIADGGAISTYDPLIGTPKDVRQKRFALGFKVTSGMAKFNKWLKVKDLTQNLKMVQQESKDIEAAKLWNNLTSTTYAGATYDGLAIAHNSHTTLAAGATYDNYGDAALGVGALEDALVYFDNTKVDDRDQKNPGRPNILAVHPAERFDAAELLGSEKQPYTADNQINSLTKDFDLEYFVYHRASSSTWWVLLDKNDPDFGAVMITTQEPDIKVQDDVAGLTRSMAVTSEQWFEYEGLDPRCIYVGDT